MKPKGRVGGKNFVDLRTARPTGSYSSVVVGAYSVRLSSLPSVVSSSRVTLQGICSLVQIPQSEMLPYPSLRLYRTYLADETIASQNL